MRKIIISAIGVLLIVGSYFGAKSIINAKKKPKPKIEKVVKHVFVENVKNGDVQIIIPANGNLVAKHRIELFFSLNGSVF